MFCGVNESALSEECSLGFAQMILDLPFVIQGMENLSLVFSNDVKSVLGAFSTNEDCDILVCLPTFKSNIGFVVNSIAQTDKRVILGVEPTGKIDWDRVTAGGAAFSYNETFLRNAIPETFDGTYVQTNQSVDDVLAKASCFVYNKRSRCASTWIDVHNVMSCSLHVEFVGCVLPRIMSSAI